MQRKELFAARCFCGAVARIKEVPVNTIHFPNHTLPLKEGYSVPRLQLRHIQLPVRHCYSSNCKNGNQRVHRPKTEQSTLAKAVGPCPGHSTPPGCLRADTLLDSLTPCQGLPKACISPSPLPARSHPAQAQLKGDAFLCKAYPQAPHPLSHRACKASFLCHITRNIFCTHPRRN